MFAQYKQVIKLYPNLPLPDERKLIRLAKRGNSSAQQTLLLHQIGFLIFRIRTILYPSVARECGEDILQECLLWAPNKIRSYNLRYRNTKGVFQPVQFRSYIWKGVTGMILQYIRKNKRESELADL
jgi:DNA-directed RNA polymerase specialized sigma24 family protein